MVVQDTGGGSFVCCQWELKATSREEKVKVRGELKVEAGPGWVSPETGHQLLMGLDAQSSGLGRW